MRIGMQTRGMQQLISKMRLAPGAVQAASRVATVGASRLIVAEVRSNLRGAPRWGHRGKSRVYRESLTVSKAKGGGGGGGMPGTLSGDLLRGVGYRRVPISTNLLVVGGVGIGKTINNLKKRYLESEFPFFAHSVHSVETEVHAVYEKAWHTAVTTSMR